MFSVRLSFSGTGGSSRGINSGKGDEVRRRQAVDGGARGMVMTLYSYSS